MREMCPAAFCSPSLGRRYRHVGLGMETFSIPPSLSQLSIKIKNIIDVCGFSWSIHLKNITQLLQTWFQVHLCFKYIYQKTSKGITLLNSGRRLSLFGVVVLPCTSVAEILTQISTKADTNLCRCRHKSLQILTQISTDSDTNHTSSFSAVSQYSKTCLHVPSPMIMTTFVNHQKSHQGAILKSMIMQRPRRAGWRFLESTRRR